MINRDAVKRRISGASLVFFVIFSVIIPCFAATNEGYGEDSTSLGQFVDSFVDMTGISLNISVERNVTLNAIELNFNTNFDYENFNTYTETDPLNKITPNFFNISWINLRRDDATRVVFDYGAGNIDDFNYTFQWSITDLVVNSPASRNLIHLVVIGQTDQAGAGDDEVIIVIREFEVFDTIFRMQLQVRDGGAGDNTNGIIDFNVSQTYWTRLSMDGQNKTIETYSDASMTVLEEKLSMLKANDAYRYLTVLRRISNANDGNDYTDGYIINFLNVTAPLIEGFDATGYFTTVDYLGDPLANGSALVALINTTIPANTQILVEFSEDGSTWVFNDWDPLFGGFESVDLRDLNYSTGFDYRFNLSTADTSVTPRVYQNRLITTIGNVSTVVRNFTGEWIEYNATEINATVGTVDAGQLNSTFFIDGNTFNVSEVIGAPGMILSVNFTGVDPAAGCIWVTVFYSYTGNLNHVFNIEMWNFTSSAWVQDGLLVDTPVFEWANSTIYGLRIPNEFLNGGKVRVRLNHETPGNINHDLFIDYIRLQAFVPTEAEAEVFQFFWIVIAIALMLIGVVISKMWFEKGDN